MSLPDLQHPVIRPWAATLQMMQNRLQDVPEPRRDILILPDDTYVDAYVGSRTWRASARGGLVTLSSVYHPEFEWHPGQVVEAACSCRSPEAHARGTITEFKIKAQGNRALIQAHVGRTCGLYAWRAGLMPTDPGVRLDGWLASDLFVHGELHLWGDVRIHERGYRATYGRPSAFYVWPAMADTTRLKTEMAASQYGVPLVQLTIPGAEECAAVGHKLAYRDPRAAVCSCECGLHAVTDEQALMLL